MTIARQSAFWLVIVLCIFLASPIEAMPWVVLTGMAAFIFFLAISLYRHHQVKRLAFEIDEVLHNGRRVDFSTSKEGDIAILSNELAKMVARLSRTSEQLASERNALADSLADISHQIRTPLTAITLMLPAIERSEDPHDRKIALRKLESMIERVSWLVTTLLKIAKIDAGAMHVERKTASCEQVVARAVAPLEAALDLHDIRLDLAIDDSATFQGDVLWTAEAVENIVKNCMEHTPAGGSITISAKEDVLATTIEIEDTGCGIDAADLPYVFDRFYRGRADSRGKAEESARSFAPSGFGVGLSLAQALVSAQEGTIRAANREEGGARFTIAFPKVVV